MKTILQKVMLGIVGVLAIVMLKPVIAHAAYTLSVEIVSEEAGMTNPSVTWTLPNGTKSTPGLTGAGTSASPWVSTINVTQMGKHIATVTGKDKVTGAAVSQTLEYTVDDLYKATFNANGHGTVPKSEVYVNGSGQITDPGNATPATGYTFKGYYTAASGGTKITFPKTITADTTWYAQWTPITYSITYNANGGNAVSNSSYTIESNAITLPTPTRTGYTFTGWTGSNGSTPQKTVTIAKGSYGNKSYTANWTPNTNTKYVVRHWQQNVDGGAAQNSTNYTLKDTDNLTGTSDAKVTPARKTYTGFTAPAGTQITINPAGTTVLDYYYTRNSYTVTVNKGEGVTATTGSGSYRYGATVTAGYTLSSGYYFKDWTSTLDPASATFVMPAQNVTLTANGKDEIPPVIVSVVPSTTALTNQNVILTITATDTDGSGIKSYSIKDSTISSTTNTLSIPADGTYTVVVKDNWDNATEYTDVVIACIDKVAPEVPAIPGLIKGADGKWHEDPDAPFEKSKKYTISVTDDRELDKVTCAELPGLGFDCESTTGSKKIEFPADGEYTFTVIDTAGTPVTFVIVIDHVDASIPVVTSVVENNGETLVANGNKWSEQSTALYKTETTYTINLSDDKALKTLIDHEGNSLDLTGATASKTFTFTRSGDYVFTVIDTVDNEYEFTLHIDHVDIEDPEVGEISISNKASEILNKSDLDYTEDEAFTYQQTLTYTVNVTDDAALDKIVDEAGNEFNAVTTNGREGYMSVLVTENGVHTYKLYDKAGNYIEFTIDTEHVDTTAPVVTVGTEKDFSSAVLTKTGSTFKEEEEFIYKKSKTYVFTATDNFRFGKVVDKDGNIVKVLENDEDTFEITYTVDGTYEYKLIDQAENVYPFSVVITNVDNTAPNATIVRNDVASGTSLTKDSDTFKEDGLEEYWEQIDTTKTYTITLTDNDRLEKVVDENGVEFDLAGHSDTFEYTFDDNKTYKFTAIDEAGNEYDFYVNITTIDKVAPEAVSVVEEDGETLVFDAEYRKFSNAGDKPEKEDLTYTVSLRDNKNLLSITDETGLYYISVLGYTDIDIVGSNVTATDVDGRTYRGTVDASDNITLNINSTFIKKVTFRKPVAHELLSNATFTVLYDTNDTYGYVVTDAQGIEYDFSLVIDRVDKTPPKADSVIEQYGEELAFDAETNTFTNVLGENPDDQTEELTYTISLSDNTHLVNIEDHEGNDHALAGVTGSLTVHFTQNGTYHYTVTDYHNNVYEFDIVITRIDTTVPTIDAITASDESLILDPETNTFTNAKTDLEDEVLDIDYTFYISDNCTVAYYVDPNGDTHAVDAATDTFDVNFDQDGEYTYKLVDNLGNENVYTVVITRIDSTLPAVELAITDAVSAEQYLNGANVERLTLDPETNTFTNSFTNDVDQLTYIDYTFIVSDNLELASIEYPDGSVDDSIDGKTLSSFEDHYTENGTYHYVLTDTKGNTYEFDVVITRIDNTEPEVITGISTIEDDTEVLVKNETNGHLENDPAQIGKSELHYQIVVGDNYNFLNEVTDDKGHIFPVTFMEGYLVMDYAYYKHYSTPDYLAAFAADKIGEIGPAYEYTHVVMDKGFVTADDGTKYQLISFDYDFDESPYGVMSLKNKKTKQTEDYLVKMTKGSFDVTFTKNGTYHYYTNDELGNAADIVIDITRIDAAPPKVDSVVAKTEGTKSAETLTMKGTSFREGKTSSYSGTKTYTINVSDDGGLKVLIADDGTEYDLTGLKSASIDIEYDTNDTYEYTLYDMANNKYEFKIVIEHIDDEAPEILGIKYSEESWTNKDIEIKITAADNTKTLQYYVSTESDCDSDEFFDKYTDSNNFVITEKGTYYIYVKDAAGNVATQKIEIDWIDREGAEITTVYLTVNGKRYEATSKNPYKFEVETDENSKFGTINIGAEDK